MKNFYNQFKTQKKSLDKKDKHMVSAQDHYYQSA